MPDLFYLVCGAVLITAPGNPEEALPIPEEHRPALLLVLRHLAVSQQLLDERELPGTFVYVESLIEDLKLVRQRHQDLSTAPFVEDVLRFPTNSAIREYLSFNRKYLEYVEAQKAANLACWTDWDAIGKETNWLYHLWHLAHEASCEYYYVHVRRDHLKQLRELIGEDAYYQGRMPPWVPIWRFQEVK